MPSNFENWSTHKATGKTSGPMVGIKRVLPSIKLFPNKLLLFGLLLDRNGIERSRILPAQFGSQRGGQQKSANLCRIFRHGKINRSADVLPSDGRR